MLANPIVLDNYRPKRELHKTPYQHFKDAEKHAQDAHTTSQDAVTSLKAVIASVLALRKALDETSSISEELAIKRISINNQISIIIEQIEINLIPACWWNKKRNFSLLSAALSEIDMLFPEQERF